MGIPIEKQAALIDRLRLSAYFQWMDRNRAGILYGIAFVLFALIMGGLHWLLSGINADFGMGVAVGLGLGWGMVFLASRQARETR